MVSPKYFLLHHADYLQLRCAVDNERCEMKFIEYDPTVALVEVHCPKCGTLGPLKFDGFTISIEWANGLIAMGESKHLPKN
jgi:hypothetical protein